MLRSQRPTNGDSFLEKAGVISAPITSNASESCFITTSLPDAGPGGIVSRTLASRGTLAVYASILLAGDHTVAGPAGGLAVRLLAAIPESLANRAAFEKRSRVQHPTRGTPDPRFRVGSHAAGQGHPRKAAARFG